ncbi:hypothetical protein OEZ85_003554 [Tetradesmus obliquus]|uniref:Ig-like domain-containing protein n=1 Tax=Tetradesmus obliquus TaxID=3088 RepID=A0ABY8UBN3_TETOB|nr:hypothetical protein OEZ85_003554 [Tetradesmus obliquus]
MRSLLAVTVAVLLASCSAQECQVPPSVVLTVANSPNFCDSSSNNTLWAEFSYSFRSVEGEPLITSVIDGGNACEHVQSERRIGTSEINGNITVTCTRPGGASFDNGLHTITLRAAYEGTLPCPGGLAFVTAQPTLLAAPKIALQAPARTQLCQGTKSFSVVFPEVQETEKYAGALQLSAALEDGTPCTATTPKPGLAGPVTVTCSSAAAAGFPKGRHTITLQAAPDTSSSSSSSSSEAISVEGCALPKPVSLVAAVVAMAPPQLRIQQVAQQEAACMNSNSVNLRFNYIVARGGDAPKLTNPKASAKFAGGSIAAAAKVACKTTLQATSSTQDPDLPPCSVNEGMYNRGPMPDGIMWSVLQAPGLSFSNNRVPADCAGGTDIGRQQQQQQQQQLA